MRKLIVTAIMSLDGYVEGPGQNVMALNMDAAFDGYNLERLEAADTLLYGAATYRGFMSFWPAMADNTETDEVHRRTGRLNRDLPKVVVSDSLGGEDLEHAATTTVVPRADARAAVAALKEAEEGREILVFGSRTLWHDLLAADLVDELHLIVGPTALGGGTPAFPSTGVTGLRLEQARRFDGSDNVLLRYTR